LRGCEEHWDKIEDLHQSVWMTLVRRLPRFRLDPARGTLPEWVAGVARRLALRHTYRRSRHPDEALTLALASVLVDEGASPAAQHDRLEREARVREIVMQFAATLPGRNRQVVIMRWIDGRMVHDIALELGATEACVYAILRRARPGLSKLLRASGLSA
jgi:RNA polymerase sigma factor (sigma-70 family)